MKIPSSNRFPRHRIYIIGLIILAIAVTVTTWQVFFANKISDPVVIVSNQTKPVTSLSPLPTDSITTHPTPLIALTLDYQLPPIVGGMDPIIYRIPTTQKVVFLTIDDGAFKDQSVIDILTQNHIKASLFLSRVFIANNPDFFKQIIAQGSVAEDHTLNHDTNMYKDQTYDQMVAEICGMSDYELSHYGKRPTLFRPPGGAYSDTMRRAAATCGIKAVVTWIAKANGGSMQYQVGDHLRPGDIVLMHFRPEFKNDMKAFIDAANKSGLQPELLEDWL